MKVKLLQDARIRHKAGDIVEVSPTEAQNLIALKVAVEAPKTAKKGKKE